MRSGDFDVCVIGLGQIGGSLAWRLTKQGYSVLGISRNESTIRYAEKMGIVMRGSKKIEEAVKAEVVILAVHIGLYNKLVDDIVNAGFHGILSDVGSVKRVFCNIARNYRLRFCGAHPMAGTEKSGIKNANPEIFEEAICVISGWSDNRAKKKVAELWRSTGAKILYLAPEKHDKVVAYTSHLPHIIAFSLVNVVSQIGRYKVISGGSYRDITRVAQSPPEMWADILIANADMVEKSALKLIREMEKIFNTMKNKDRLKLIKYISDAREKCK